MSIGMDCMPILRIIDYNINNIQLAVRNIQCDIRVHFHRVRTLVEGQECKDQVESREKEGRHNYQKDDSAEGSQSDGPLQCVLI